MELDVIGFGAHTHTKKTHRYIEIYNIPNYI